MNTQTTGLASQTPLCLVSSRVNFLLFDGPVATRLTCLSQHRCGWEMRVHIFLVKEESSTAAWLWSDERARIQVETTPACCILGIVSSGELFGNLHSEEGSGL